MGLPQEIVVSPDGKNAYVANGDFSSGGVAIFDRDPATGALTQKSGACFSDDGSGGCQDGEKLSGANDVVVSPDGKHVYVTAYFSYNIAVFDRDATTGALTQKPGVAVDRPRGLGMSPDGKNIYIAAGDAASVLIFDRDTTTGALTQKSGTAGCISDDGTGGACQNGTALGFPIDVVVSPDGKNAYVTSQFASAVAIFDRDTTTGALTQKSGTAGCISDDGTGEACQDGAGLGFVNGIAVSPDGKNVYAAGESSGAVAILDRDVTTGALTQKSGTAGCISDSGTEGACHNGYALSEASGVVVSFDGRSVYVAAQGTSSVAIFDRDTTTGALTQKSGTAGCISDDGTGDLCQVGDGLNRAIALTVSPDDKNVYTAAFYEGVAIFDRVLAPLTLTVVKAGSGTGTVTSEPAGIDCGADCSEDYTVGTEVTLTAASAPGSSFAGFSGAGCTGSATTCTVTLDEAQTVTARFTRNATTPPATPPARQGTPAPSAGGKTINGTPGKDRLVGTPGNDVINCGAGDDVVIAGAGDDIINCGAGNDTIDSGAGRDKVSGGSGNDKIKGGSGNDRLSGNAGKDKLSGNSGNDRLLGGGGADRLSGGSGNDVLIGGGGRDLLNGGPGKDKEKQ